MALSVKMYSLSTCSHCHHAKKFMDDCAVAYEFRDIDLLVGEERQAILDEIIKINPRCTFPTIVIGDKVIIGFDEKEIRECLGL